MSTDGSGSQALPSGYLRKSETKNRQEEREERLQPQRWPLLGLTRMVSVKQASAGRKIILLPPIYLIMPLGTQMSQENPGFRSISDSTSEIHDCGSIKWDDSGVPVMQGAVRSVETGTREVTRARSLQIV